MSDAHMPAQRGHYVNPETQIVVCAAVLYSNGTMLVGPRHFDSVMRAQYSALGLKLAEADSQQGFIDQWGNFLTRAQAYEVALRKGQIRRRVGGDAGKLFSENLY